jgi:predicted TIM-barrel fold metal-dependent hydrolase
MNRRQFLHSSLAVACAAGTARAETTRDAMPIVDTHQHLWDLAKFKLPWIAKGSSLARSFLLEDYRKATEGLNVVKTVYMEVDVDPSQQDAEADHVLDLCRRFAETRMAAAVISGRPAADGFKKYISRFKDSKYIKGIRQVLHGEGTKRGYGLEAKFLKGIQLLGELGLSFDLCLRPGELLDGAKIIDACPATRFILDHCGNANVQATDRSPWEKDIAAVARRKNVVCKVSGIVASAKPGAWTADDLAPIVNHTLEVFGPDRVMFGGDWPVCTLAATFRQWVEALRAIVRSRKDEEQRKLFHDNAVKLYGLA